MCPNGFRDSFTSLYQRRKGLLVMRGFLIVAKVIWIALLVGGVSVSSKMLLAQQPPHAPEDLAIGKIAPEIEGTDVNGMPFKLSDYRGKVVLLDFWGDW